MFSILEESIFIPIDQEKEIKYTISRNIQKEKHEIICNPDYQACLMQVA